MATTALPRGRGPAWPQLGAACGGAPAGGDAFDVAGNAGGVVVVVVVVVEGGSVGHAPSWRGSALGREWPAGATGFVSQYTFPHVVTSRVAGKSVAWNCQYQVSQTSQALAQTLLSMDAVLTPCSVMHGTKIVLAK
jgi:hypothetical protein